jgi:hypothetical protein
MAVLTGTVQADAEVVPSAFRIKKDPGVREDSIRLLAHGPFILASEKVSKGAHLWSHLAKYEVTPLSAILGPRRAMFACDARADIQGTVSIFVEYLTKCGILCGIHSARE